jgi:hypothetical protein
VRLNPKQKPLRVNSRIYPKGFVAHPPDRSMETTKLADRASVGADTRNGELRTASFLSNKGSGQDLRTHSWGLLFGVQAHRRSLGYARDDKGQSGCCLGNG